MMMRILVMLHTLLMLDTLLMLHTLLMMPVPVMLCGLVMLCALPNHGTSHHISMPKANSFANNDTHTQAATR